MFNKIPIYYSKNQNFYESKLLSINSQKIKKVFNIQPILNFKETAQYISDWYKCYFKNFKDIQEITKTQILNFSKKSKLIIK